MDVYTVNGLPLHVLLVHVVVILLPVTAICVLLAAIWPTVRRRLGIVIALLGLVIIGLIPLTTQAGQWLKDRVAGTPLIEAHATLGNALWPWSLSLGILAIVTWLWYFVTERRDRRRAPHAKARRTVGVVIALLAISLGGVATYQTVLVGDSGSRAIWQNSFSDTPLK